MTKVELIELVRTDMLEAINQRDMTDPFNYDEAYGYFHGQYHAYESVLKLLTMFTVQELSDGDNRRIRR